MTHQSTLQQTVAMLNDQLQNAGADDASPHGVALGTIVALQCFIVLLVVAIKVLSGRVLASVRLFATGQKAQQVEAADDVCTLVVSAQDDNALGRLELEGQHVQGHLHAVGAPINVVAAKHQVVGTARGAKAPQLGTVRQVVEVAVQVPK